MRNSSQAAGGWSLPLESWRSTPIRTRSAELTAEARRHMPGGVSSPVRAFRAVGGEPLVFVSGRGPRIADADGNEYLDLVGSWGPMILGHAHPEVVEAVREAATRGLSFGATSESEIRLAAQIKRMFPSIEKVRLVNSGTEATMSALRVARGFTGRDRVIKFEGCYHGHSDGLLAKAGSGTMTLGLPDSAGVPANVTRDTLTAPYNDLSAVDALLDDQVAAVILEPVAGNMGLVPPAAGFLEGLRELTRQRGALLIFDEVMTGFRLARGGAQEYFGVQPDLTCLGKIVGGGLPVGAYGGRADIMDMVAPAGPVYQAGTLSGNPLTAAAGLATLQVLERDPGLYARLEKIGQTLEERWAAAIRGSATQGRARVQRVGSMLTLFFTPDPVTDYASAKRCDTEAFARFFQGMLDRGVYLPPSQFESAFLNAALDESDMEHLASAAEEALR